MEIGFVLEEVQMSPCFLRGVICWSRGATNRAYKRSSLLKVDGDVEPVGLFGKLDVRNFPGRDNTKGHTKKSFRLHILEKPPDNGLKAHYTITHVRRRGASKSDIASFGGISATRCTWSGCTFNSTTSQPA
jgi:hypothetical protein